MRVIGEFDVEDIKVTVFQMNEKTSAKFEYNLLEQTYKFRDGSGIRNTNDVRSFCTNEIIRQIKEIFHQMSMVRISGVLASQDVDDEFDTIL